MKTKSLNDWKWLLLMMLALVGFGAAAFGRTGDPTQTGAIHTVEVQSSTGWCCSDSAVECAAEYRAAIYDGTLRGIVRTTCSGAGTGCSLFGLLAR
jgi:hypothetical protein